MRILENTLQSHIRSVSLKQAFITLQQDLFALIDDCIHYHNITDLTVEINSREFIEVTQTGQIIFRPINVYSHDQLIAQHLTLEQVCLYLQALIDRRMKYLNENLG